MSPYIDQNARDLLAAGRQPETLGELNYAITRLCLGWLADYGDNYGAYAAIVGVLETAKLELYRRVVVPYEQDKCEINGDVYPVPEFDEGDIDE